MAERHIKFHSHTKYTWNLWPRTGHYYFQASWSRNQHHLVVLAASFVNLPCHRSMPYSKTHRKT